MYPERTYIPARHVPTANWATWTTDVHLAERILIYTYSPPYNSVSIAEPPPLGDLDQVMLLHSGARHRRQLRDIAPDDWP